MLEYVSFAQNENSWMFLYQSEAKWPMLMKRSDVRRIHRFILDAPSLIRRKLVRFVILFVFCFYYLHKPTAAAKCTNLLLIGKHQNASGIGRCVLRLLNKVKFVYKILHSQSKTRLWMYFVGKWTQYFLQDFFTSSTEQQVTEWCNRFIFSRFYCIDIWSSTGD